MSGSEKVLSINGVAAQQPEPDEHTVQILEDVLERARAGKVVGVALVATTFDRDVAVFTAGWVGGDTMIGAMSRLHHNLLAESSE